MREQVCCFTGHRRIPQNELKGIEERLEATITELYSRGVVYYGAGGALGFDTLAAETVMRLRDGILPNLRLILVLPCLNQTKGWKAEDVARYEEIKRKANKVKYVSQEYTSECMCKRNRHLVDGSSVCVCYQMQNTGGTAYTVQYAKRQGLRVINVARDTT